MPHYFDFRVSLKGISPKIWRRFLLADSASFEELHEAIQASFGWEYEHLYEFKEKGGRGTIARAGYDEGDAPPVHELTLASFFQKPGTKCMYVYDFGDNWEHVVELVGVVDLPEKFRQRLLAGARACPPEDRGGIGGYMDCVQIASMSDADIKKAGAKDGEIAERKEWLGDWKPDNFNLAKVKKKFDR
jgi:hypothetical protein